MKRTRIHYSREFKIKAVELSNARGTVIGVAEELNVNRETLKRWKKDFKAGRLNLSATKPKSAEAEEISRLKRELYNIKLEHEILKKAVSIFSKSER